MGMKGFVMKKITHRILTLHGRRTWGEKKENCKYKGQQRLLFFWETESFKWLKRFSLLERKGEQGSTYFGEGKGGRKRFFYTVVIVSVKRRQKATSSFVALPRRGHTAADSLSLNHELCNVRTPFVYLIFLKRFL